MSENFEMSSVKSWIDVEAKKARTGDFPVPSGSNHEVYLAWIRDCNARKGHSLVLADPKDPASQKVDDLLKVRTLLFRGELGQAESIIQNLRKAEADPELQIEALLEQARLAAYQGDWNLAHALSLEAISSQQLASLSYLSTLQVHALSCFERGDFQGAINTLNSADSLSVVYPFSISTLYAKVLRARIAARNQGVDAGLQAINEILNDFRTSNRVLTGDSVHAVVFGIADIFKYAQIISDQNGTTQNRSEQNAKAGKELSARLANTLLASFQMTEAMGERLYSALASLDAAVCGPLEHRKWFFDQLAQSRKEFKRIDRLVSEVFESKAVSSTSAALLTSLLKSDRDAEQKSVQPPTANHLVFFEQKWAFQLNPWKAVDLQAHPQILKALLALSQKDLTKAEFFQNVWGNARYTSHLHDSSIWYVLSRIKKLTGIHYQARSGTISASTAVIGL
jgi:hypothetical protein